MASSKTLIRAGVSLMARFLNPNPNPTNQILSRSSGIIAPPKFLPSLFIPQSHTTTPLHLNKDEVLRELSTEGFLYPSGLPSLPFFLPNGDESMSKLQITDRMNTQLQSSDTLKEVGKATKGGRRVIARRIAKGRARITA